MESEPCHFVSACIAKLHESSVCLYQGRVCTAKQVKTKCMEGNKMYATKSRKLELETSWVELVPDYGYGWNLWSLLVIKMGSHKPYLLCLYLLSTKSRCGIEIDYGYIEYRAILIPPIYLEIWASNAIIITSVGNAIDNIYIYMNVEVEYSKICLYESSECHCH